MPVKKPKTRNSKSTYQPATKTNQLTVVIICSLFVVVGLFLVYKSLAAVIMN